MSSRARETETPGPERPPIWVAGRQQPKFDPRAWAVVGHALTRRWLAPRIDSAAGALTRLGERFTAGLYRVNTDWMGKANRLLPSHLAVGAVVTGVAARMNEARAILLPRPTAPEPQAYPNLIRPSFRPPDTTPRLVGPAMPAAARLATAKPDAGKLNTVKLNIVKLAAAMTPPASPARLPKCTTHEPTLTAIRAMIHAKPTPAQTQIQPDSAPGTTAAPAAITTRPSWLRPHLAGLAAHSIAWSALGLSLPVGLVQATLYHLNGGDLTDWD